MSFIIFIDIFVPKWARGPHNLARFPSWDPCITPWVWSVVFNCFANIRITDQIAFLCVHAPRVHICLRFLCAVSVFDSIRR